jgi:hypothetical protein
MAHYAFLDSNNVVVKVITGVHETVTQLDNGVEVGGSSEAWEQFYENQSWHSGLTCKRTSYNNNIRKQYAGIGFTYDADADVFVAPQPYGSWTLDENFDWQPPTPQPYDSSDDVKRFYWNEEELEWIRK